METNNLAPHNKGKIMLYKNTPIGKIQVSEWEEKPLMSLADEQLLQKAIEENNTFCISPAVFAMVEKRLLTRELQRLINPNLAIRNQFN